jgi:hypothetical protein
MASYWELLRSGELTPEQIVEAAKIAAIPEKEKKDSPPPEKDSSSRNSTG